MNTHKLSRLTAGPLWLLLVVLVLFSAGKASAVAIPVANGDFSLSADAGSQGAVLGSYDALVGTSGPWRASGIGAVTLLLAPTVTIGSGPTGNATISGLLYVNILGLSNSATIYNNNVNASTTFVTGQTYTLTVDFTTTLAIDANLLTSGNFGISLRSNGTDVASTQGVSSTISVLAGNKSGTVSLSYTAPAGVNGTSIGISLFVGKGSTSLANIGALGDISFDNVTLSAIPEPSTWAIWASILAFVAVSGQRFFRRRTASPRNL